MGNKNNNIKDVACYGLEVIATNRFRNIEEGKKFFEELKKQQGFVAITFVKSSPIALFITPATRNAAYTNLNKGCDETNLNVVLVIETIYVNAKYLKNKQIIEE